MIVTYKCAFCGEVFTKEWRSNPAFSQECSCGEYAKRQFKEIQIDKIDDNVSAAIQTTLYGKLPSGADKKVL